MNKKHSEKIYSPPLFREYDRIFCGTTTRKFGRANRDIDSIQNLLAIIGGKKNECVTGEQTHGNTVATVLDTDIGTIFPGTDGLVYHVKNSGAVRRVFLGVYTADCVPVFFYDPVLSLIGICHAGYRGVLGKIIRNMVTEYMKNGSNPSHIRVALGPHIRACSYSVPPERARMFEEMYGKESGVVSVSDNMQSVNLSEAIRIDLISMGVTAGRIDHDSSPCTYCYSDVFYSYRKRAEEEYGEMMSFIGLR